MKIYKVKVNGKVFEVELEAVSESKETIKSEVKEEKAPTTVTGGTVKAPIAGKVTNIKVNVGDVIKVGDVIGAIEAMKLENEVPATSAGKVKQILVKKGDAVKNGDDLIELE